MSLEIRPLIESDRPFVLSSWKLGLRKFPAFRDVPNPRFFPWVSERIERTLHAPSTTVTVAADASDHWHVSGYVVADRAANALLWVYVKQSLRGMGLARTLVRYALDVTRPIAVGHNRLPPWLGSFAALAMKHGLTFDPTVE